MRVLITGVSGFAGRWLAGTCAEAGEEVTGASRSGGDGHVSLDLRDGGAVARLIERVAPDVIYHLAALSHVGRSWEDPAATLEHNVSGAVNLLEAVRRHAPTARVVWASSCEVYGSPNELPITEAAALCPATPYAVSKAAGDMLAAVYAEAYGLAIMRARPFNHAGPGQRPIFIVSSLAEQAARARLADTASVRIVTGNPDTRRDFTDVRDVVRAYRLLAGPGVPPGVYNVSSGRSVSAAEHVALLTDLIAPIEVEHVVDPARVRPHEVMNLYGSHELITSVTGWRPEIPLDRTISDTVAWWEEQLSRGGSGPIHRAGGPAEPLA